MTIEQKLTAVRENIAKLTAIVPADQLIYRPAELQDLTLEEFKALLVAMPKMNPSTFFTQYEASGDIGGVWVNARTAKGTRVELNPVQAELNALAIP